MTRGKFPNRSEPPFLWLKKARMSGQSLRSSWALKAMRCHGCPPTPCRQNLEGVLAPVLNARKLRLCEPSCFQHCRRGGAGQEQNGRHVPAGRGPASLPARRSWREPAGRPPNLPCRWEVCQAQPVCPPWRPCQAALPRPHEELAEACQAVSHLERVPAAAQTFQRGHADANPAQGLGNRAAGSSWSESATVSFFLPTF